MADYRHDHLRYIICPHCQTRFDAGLDMTLEPMFTLKQAAPLIPMSAGQISTFLTKHPEVPRRYRQDSQHRKYRILTASELRYMRAHIVKNYGWDKANPTRLRPEIMRFSRAELSRLFPTIDWRRRQTTKPYNGPNDVPTGQMGVTVASPIDSDTP